jgi:hypothetical protein
LPKLFGYGFHGCFEKLAYHYTQIEPLVPLTWK